MADLLTASEVAILFRASDSAIYAWARAGILPCIRIGSVVRFRADTVHAILDRGRIERVQELEYAAAGSRP